MGNLGTAGDSQEKMPQMAGMSNVSATKRTRETDNGTESPAGRSEICYVCSSLADSIDRGCRYDRRNPLALQYLPIANHADDWPGCILNMIV